MATRTLWVIKGIGDDNPEKIKVTDNETVGNLKEKYAKELGVTYSNIEVSTDQKRLSDQSTLFEEVGEGEQIHILPRAKAGRN
mgnify:CR=1 FL=1